MRTFCVKNGLVVGIILLFIGVAIQPSIATVQPVEETIDVEPKDYLFQTIIDIANNPNVKELLERYNYKMFTSDYDYKGVLSKLLIRKPRLLFNVLFTKPSITYDYLDKSYNRGIEITNIISEDNVLEMIASIEVTNPELFNEFNNIIMNDEELSGKLATLKEMNKEYVSDLSWDFPIIRGFLKIIVILFENISYALFIIVLGWGFAIFFVIFGIWILYSFIQIFIQDLLNR